jgi:hypothetical protein
MPSTLLASLLLLSPMQAEEVSIRTLLPQMADLMHLTQRPSPAYMNSQDSSYDRKSNPGQGSDPFANGDFGQYLRVESNGGRREHVMGEMRGPGALVRIWSANPTGTIRFYFDGESEARLAASMDDLLRGRVAPFLDPFAYTAAMGTNLYFPLPYERSLKVTVEEAPGVNIKGLYYQLNYRSYEPGTRVQTFTLSQVEAAASAMNSVRARLARPDLTVPTRLNRQSLEPRLLPAGASRRLDLSGPLTVREVTVQIPFPLVQTLREMDWNDPHQPHNVLRNVQMDLVVDGQVVSATPLGDFFGSAPGLNPYRSLPFEVRADGTMICRLPIPARRGLSVLLRNNGPVQVPLRMEIGSQPGVPSGTLYTLHAQWQAERGRTRPFRDMNFLDARGEGLWFGSHLHISNPTDAWWGEGDEKVYVDGESFPSTFGTGTEDYYGYAWCSNEVYQRPYHSQPRADGPANYGHSSVNRWHVLDPIPFRKSLRFDMEMWHWQDVEATFAYTSYWYAPPGQTRPARINRDLLTVLELAPPKPVEGALEGEKMEIVNVSGGRTQNQGGFFGLSNGLQLWWLDNQPGNRLTLKIPVAAAGRYEVIGNFCHAQDYGIHRLRLGGKDIPPIDFYGPGVEWRRISLGTFDLPAGHVLLEVEVVGKRPEALPAHMFGLDYLLLQRRG